MFTVLPTVLNKKFVVLFTELGASRPSVISRHDTIEDAKYTADRLNKVVGK